MPENLTTCKTCGTTVSGPNKTAVADTMKRHKAKRHSVKAKLKAKK